LTQTLILAAGPLELALAPEVGGSVAWLDHDGRPVMRRATEGYGDVLQAACFPMVPYVNRIRDGRFTFRGRSVALAPMQGQRHPLHGDGWRAPWTVVEVAGPAAALSFSHPASDWPWSYEASQVFALDAEGLTVTLSVTNTSQEPMPAGLGLHPYFPCNGETILDASVEGVWTVDAEVMPVRREPAGGRYDLARRRICGADLDNGYDGLTGRATLDWPDRGLSLSFGAEGAGYFQVYAPAEGGMVVAEAVTHANAVLNLPEDKAVAAGLRIVDPGDTFALVTRFDVRAHG
jgi:aldose 1-epimerase